MLLQKKKKINNKKTKTKINKLITNKKTKNKTKCQSNMTTAPAPIYECCGFTLGTSSRMYISAPELLHSLYMNGMDSL